MIRLKRQVQVRTFEVEATIAVGRDRPEFLAVARLAADMGRPIGGRDITRELLGGLPDQVGWYVLERALAMGLLERDGDRGPAALSESGRDMLEQGTVLVPEEGVWRLYWLEDPLVPNPLVHVQRLDSEKAREERKRLKDRGRGNRPASGRPVPSEIQAIERRICRSVSNGRAFQVRDFGERGEIGPRGSLTLLLDWSPGLDPEVRLRGEMPADDEEAQARVDVRLPHADPLGQFSYKALWIALASIASRVPQPDLAEWSQRTGRLVVPNVFDSALKSAERRSFSKQLKVAAVGIGPLGDFEATTLDGVTLVAASDSDAQAWAEWLLHDSISEYVLPSQLAEAARRVAACFPTYDLDLPDAWALLEQALAAPQERTSRFLLAPADLGLWS